MPWFDTGHQQLAALSRFLPRWRPLRGSAKSAGLQLLSLEERLLLSIAPPSLDLLAATVATVSTSTSLPNTSGVSDLNGHSTNGPGGPLNGAPDSTVTAPAPAVTAMTLTAANQPPLAAYATANQSPPAPTNVELVVIDRGIDNLDALVQSIMVLPSHTPREYLQLDTQQDGIQAVTNWLATHATEHVTAIHFLTHGADAAVQLGSTWLQASNIAQYSGELQQWKSYLGPTTDLLWYGCDVAADARGQQFVDQIATALNCDVAASTNGTGAAARGGDWNLEYSHGSITTTAIVDPGWDGILSAFTVTNSNDNGAGSLRQAILNANANAGLDTINFQISGGSKQIISLQTALPAITDSVIIDATTQTGYAGTPLIELNGNPAGANAIGLDVRASNSTIKGFAIRGFSSDGIDVSGSNVTIVANYIGINTNGVANGNSGIGIKINNGANNTIGGTTAATRNVIAANSGGGILITGSSAQGNLIEGNYIGVKPDGSTAAGNSSYGIMIDGTATGNVIGAITAGAGNLIVNNSGAGVAVNSGIKNAIRGNSIFANTGQGIDLNNDNKQLSFHGPGAGTGPNLNQNYPTLTAVNLTANSVTLTGTLYADSNSTYKIDYYANPAGGAQGQQYLGSTTTTTIGTIAAFSNTYTVTLPVGTTFTAVATDSAGNSSEFGPSIFQNTPPTISSISDVTVVENHVAGPLNFTVGDAQTSASSLVVTATSNNQTLIPNANLTLGGSGASRTITVTPAANQFGGPATITVTVSDGIATTTTTFNVTVDSPPTIASIADQVVTKNQSLGPLSFTVADVETAASSLIVTATSSNPTLIPLSGITLGGTGANRTVTITPAANATGGPATITLFVDDGTTTASTTFNVLVNSPPTITSISNQQVVTGATLGPLAFTVGDAETLPTALTVTATSSNQTLIPNANLVLGGSGANRTITLSSAANQFGGPATITLTVSDGSTTTNSTFTVTVDSPPTISSIGNQVLVRNTSSSPLAFTIGDADTAIGSLSVSATSSNQTLIPAANLVIAGSGANRTLTITPAANQTGGPATIQLTVSDGVTTTSTSFTVTVDSPPTISAVANQTVMINQPTGPLAFTVGDLETAAGSLTVSAVSSDQTLIPNANLVLGGTGANRTISITPATGLSGGPVTITLSVSDGTVSTTSAFTVAINTPPTITGIADQVFRKNSTLGPLSFTVGDAETTASALVVTAHSSNTTLIPNANITLGGSGATRTISITPTANLVGQATITLTVSDGVSTTNTTFNVTVDTPPTITSVANQIMGKNYTLGPLGFDVSDPFVPASALVVTATSSDQTLIPNANLVLGGTGSDRTITISPTKNLTGGPATITLTVSDGADSTSTTFTVTVVAPPTVSSISNQTINANTSTGALAFTVGDSFFGANALTITALSDNQTLLPNANIALGGTGANRTINLTPAANQAGGPAMVTIKVDNGHAYTLMQFNVTVQSVATPPHDHVHRQSNGLRERLAWSAEFYCPRFCVARQCDYGHGEFKRRISAGQPNHPVGNR